MFWDGVGARSGLPVFLSLLSQMRKPDVGRMHGAVADVPRKELSELGLVESADRSVVFLH